VVDRVKQNEKKELTLIGGVSMTTLCGYSTTPRTFSSPGKRGNRKLEVLGLDFKFPITAARSDGRCNTIWYKAVFKGGVYETRETVWAFSGAEERRVASLEGRADVA
jgi:hypothetical protein